MKLQNSIRGAISATGAIVILTSGACNLDVTNPNAGKEESVLSTAAGLRGVAVGMTSPMLRDATSAARATGTREGVSCRVTSLSLAAKNGRGGLLTEA